MTWTLVFQISVLMIVFGMVYDLFIKPHKWDRPRRPVVMSNGRKSGGFDPL